MINHFAVLYYISCIRDVKRMGIHVDACMHAEDEQRRRAPICTCANKEVEVKREYSWNESNLMVIMFGREQWRGSLLKRIINKLQT